MTEPDSGDKMPEAVRSIRHAIRLRRVGMAFGRAVATWVRANGSARPNRTSSHVADVSEIKLRRLHPRAPYTPEAASVASSRDAVPKDFEAPITPVLLQELERGEEAMSAVEDLHRPTEDDGAHRE